MSELRRAFKIARSLVSVLPRQGDTALELIVKGAAAVEVIRNEIEHDVSPLELFVKENHLKSRRSRQLVNVFFQTPLGDSFEKKRLRIGDGTELLELSREDVGSLYFVQRNADYGSEFYYSDGADLSSILAALWDHYDGRINIRISKEGEISYTSFPVSGDELYGTATKRLQDFVEKYRLMKADGVARTYLFVGPPGVGKSTLAARAATELGGRILRLDAQSLTRFEASEMEFVLGALRPDTTIVDDVDKADGMARYSEGGTSILQVLEWFKMDHPSVLLLMTSNTIDGLPQALIRPGRIDEPLIFKLPTKPERRAILKGYVDALPKARQPTAKQLDTLATKSEGLAGAWLKEIAIQLRYVTVPEAYKIVSAQKALIAGMGAQRARRRRRKPKPKPEPKKTEPSS